MQFTLEADPDRCKWCAREAGCESPKRGKGWCPRYRYRNAEEPTGGPTKVCGRCGRRLPRSAFWAAKDKRDGLQSVCKDCWPREDGIRWDTGGE